MADGNSGADAERPETGSHNLLTIPTELLELIVEFVEPRDLLYLRRVSRAIAQGTSKRFFKHFFSKRAFLLNNEDSLRALLAIAENETTARKLRTIDLCIEEVPDPEFETQDLRDLYQPTSRARNLTDKLELKYNWHQREWHTLYEKQEDNRQQSVDLHLLTVIFSRIRRLQHSVEIRVVDRHEACEVPLGMKNLERLCDEPLRLMEDTNRAVPLVLEAIALSGMPLSSFVVRFSDWDWAPCTFTDRPSRLDNTRDAFRHLKKLHLIIDDEVAMFPKDRETRMDVIASASMVEDLSLQVRRRGNWRTSYDLAIQNLYDTLMRSFPRLKTFDLQGYNLTMKQLEDLVAYHSQLERLHFHGGEEHHPAHPDGKFGIHPYIVVDGYMRISVFDDESPSALYLAGFRKDLFIAPCTVWELTDGKDAWDEDLRESRRSWEESNFYLLEDPLL